MLRETLGRLTPVAPLKNMWAVTNVEQAAAVRREMRAVPASHILAEPVGAIPPRRLAWPRFIYTGRTATR